MDQTPSPGHLHHELYPLLHSAKKKKKSFVLRLFQPDIFFPTGRDGSYDHLFLFTSCFQFVSNVAKNSGEVPKIATQLLFYFYSETSFCVSLEVVLELTL